LTSPITAQKLFDHLAHGRVTIKGRP